ncbi:unnamed protein product [Auanema sp. JU1783]|nr:unnamed protein product [Auanema sp. JU1783]
MIPDEERISDWDYTDNEAEPDQPEEEEKEFTIIGEPEYVNTDKIAVTSSWVENANVFPAELREENLSGIDEVDEIPKRFVKKLKEHFQKLFPVQKSVLPILLKEIREPSLMRRRDVTIAAPTGSGKTLCYVLPTLVAIGKHPAGVISTLIVVPVQALVKQIECEYQKFNVYDAKIITLTGTDKTKDLRKSLSENNKLKCDILITTPNRLVDFLTEEHNPFDLSALRYLVVDEADKMGMKVRLEWLDLVEKRYGGTKNACNVSDWIASRCAAQKILLSATISRDVEELFLWNLHRPSLFKATSSSSVEVKLPNANHITGGVLALPSSIKHTFLSTEPHLFPLVVYNEIIQAKFKKVIIFTKEKESASRLSRFLNHLSKGTFHTGNLTSNVFANRLTKIIEDFEIGKSRVLICTDVLARGIDISSIDCVINYDLPLEDRLFVHRAGRTGRAGSSGSVISIGFTDTERRFLHMLKKMKLYDGMNYRKVTDDDLASLKPAYEEALSQLQHEMMKKGVITIKKQVSGRKYQRRRRWEPASREKKKVQAETMEKLAHLHQLRNK